MSEYAKKNNAELVFINEDSFGIEMADGTLSRIHIEDLIDILK